MTRIMTSSGCNRAMRNWYDSFLLVYPNRTGIRHKIKSLTDGLHALGLFKNEYEI